MPVSANDLVTRAMKALQALGSNEVPTALEANDGLVALNAMLDSWSLDDLVSYEVEEQSFPLSPGTAAYTIGVGGVINTVRPQEIVQAYVRDSGNNNFGMRLVPRDKWNQIGNRGPTITSQIPHTMFYDPQYPLGIINVFPTPLLPYTCFFDNVLNQVTLATLATNIAMPVGYERAYVFNLAVEISSMFGIPIPAVGPGQKNVAQLAAESLAAVKANNIKDVISNYDGAIISRSYATYNIFSDSFGRNN
jgi:hypothetical protein